MNGDRFNGSFEQARTEQLRRLKAIARLASAYLQEPTDPAIADARDGLIIELAEYHDFKQSALTRGFQI